AGPVSAIVPEIVRELPASTWNVRSALRVRPRLMALLAVDGPALRFPPRVSPLPPRAWPLPVKARPRKVAPTKSLVLALRAALAGNCKSSTPGTGATSPTQLAAVDQLLFSGLPPSQTRVAGATRSSSTSSRGRAAGRRLGLGGGRAAGASRVRFKNEDTMGRNLLRERGLRDHG